jgi:hypothetical protein
MTHVAVLNTGTHAPRPAVDRVDAVIQRVITLKAKRHVAAETGAPVGHPVQDDIEPGRALVTTLAILGFRSK